MRKHKDIWHFCVCLLPLLHFVFIDTPTFLPQRENRLQYLYFFGISGISPQVFYVQNKNADQKSWMEAHCHVLLGHRQQSHP